jgi:hypothetical protein
MRLRLDADPSVIPELTEFSLGLVLLITMGLFLGGFAVKQADQVISQTIAHHSVIAG